MSHPPLTKTQRDVLGTVRWEPRVERWNHKTLSYLRALGLVTAERANPLLNGLYRWTVTASGVEAYGARAGTRVSPLLTDTIGKFA